jgi:hypothetical protein
VISCVITHKSSSDIYQVLLRFRLGIFNFLLTFLHRRLLCLLNSMFDSIYLFILISHEYMKLGNIFALFQENLLHAR